MPHLEQQKQTNPLRSQLVYSTEEHAERTASIASIFPSWPPPRMPTVAPRGSPEALHSCRRSRSEHDLPVQYRTISGPACPPYLGEFKRPLAAGCCLYMQKQPPRWLGTAMDLELSEVTRSQRCMPGRAC